MTTVQAIVVSTLVGAIPSLLPAYVIALVVGGGFLLLAVLLGGEADGADVGADLGGDLDVDIDVDVDVDADMDADGLDHGGSAISQWFSMQFLVHFTTLFGVVGTVLTLMTDMTPWLVAVLAAGIGLFGGQAVHQLMRGLKRTSGNSAAKLQDYIERPGRVTIALAPGRRGEVAVTVGGSEKFVAARAQHREEAFGVGDRVVVVSFSQGTAEVVSLKEYEFVNEPNQEGGTI